MRSLRGARLRPERLPQLQAEQAARLAEEASQACVNAPQASADDGALILCELATAQNPDLARYGCDGIFRGVVEPLGDGFEPALCDRYVRFFARVIQYCRDLPSASWAHERLLQFGIASEADLIARMERLRVSSPHSSHAVRVVFVLSRVTLGADVAITSVILRKVLQRFPDARVVLLAGPKTALLFAEERRIEVRPVEYPRGGSLLDRLAAWPVTVDAIAQETQHLPPGECLVVDPDSRLTQLGMLPVIPDEAAYHFFESRSFTAPGSSTLAELTAAWLEQRFGRGAEPLYPWVALPSESLEKARAIRASLRGRSWTAVNLGVGDNPQKRIESGFEERLLCGLLQAGHRILLDKGDGSEETSRVEQLLQPLRDARFRVVELDEQGEMPPVDAQVVAWRGSLAGFASLIGISDLYIGYDSACQHIAAAMGVKAIDIFAGFRSPRMVERWKPTSRQEVIPIVVNDRGPAEVDRILKAVMEAAR